MIIRGRIFSPHPRADFWALIEGFSKLQSPEAEVSALYALVASLASYRYTWKGAVMEWVYATFILSLDALVAVLPMPVRVLVTNKRTIWRVKWLGWVFLWGRRFDGRTWFLATDRRPGTGGCLDCGWHGREEDLEGHACTRASLHEVPMTDAEIKELAASADIHCHLWVPQQGQENAVWHCEMCGEIRPMETER